MVPQHLGDQSSPAISRTDAHQCLETPEQRAYASRPVYLLTAVLREWSAKSEERFERSCPNSPPPAAAVS
jgi:hypothetical protein